MTGRRNQIDRKIHDTARAAVRAAGAVIRKKRGGRHRIARKGMMDLVTEVDLMAEKAVTAIIGRVFPAHQVIAEESGIRERQSDYVWWLDPLDGTTNFAHGYPHYAVSLALEYRGEIVLGFVYEPVRDELFSARLGEGAYLNGERIRVSRVTRLEESLLATGFPYDITKRPRALSLVGRLLTRIQELRRDGSAALNLSYVAAGRLDGFWEFGLRPWDTAAGVLLVKEAGGKVSDFRGGKFAILEGEMAAGNPRLHPLLVQILGGTDRKK